MLILSMPLPTPLTHGLTILSWVGVYNAPLYTQSPTGRLNSTVFRRRALRWAPIAFNVALICCVCCSAFGWNRPVVQSSSLDRSDSQWLEGIQYPTTP